MKLENPTYFVRSLFGILDVSQGGHEHEVTRKEVHYLWHVVSK
jgi:hypothetical protein